MSPRYLLHGCIEFYYYFVLLFLRLSIREFIAVISELGSVVKDCML